MLRVYRVPPIAWTELLLLHGGQLDGIIYSHARRHYYSTMTVILISAQDECIGGVERIPLIRTINASLIGRSFVANAVAYMQASESRNEK